MSSVLVLRGNDMFIGESKVQGVVVSCDENAVLSNATYQLYKDGALFQAGPIAASIEGNTVYANIPSGESAGSFIAVFTFSLDEQILKAQVNYQVLAIPQ